MPNPPEKGSMQTESDFTQESSGVERSRTMLPSTIAPLNPTASPGSKELDAHVSVCLLGTRAAR